MFALKIIDFCEELEMALENTSFQISFLDLGPQ